MITLSQILKPKAKLESRKLDFENDEIKSILAKCLEGQKRILKLKMVDSSQLSKVITI